MREFVMALTWRWCATSSWASVAWISTPRIQWAVLLCCAPNHELFVSPAGSYVAANNQRRCNPPYGNRGTHPISVAWVPITPACPCAVGASVALYPILGTRRAGRWRAPFRAIGIPVGAPYWECAVGPDTWFGMAGPQWKRIDYISCPPALWATSLNGPLLLVKIQDFSDISIG